MKKKILSMLLALALLLSLCPLTAFAESEECFEQAAEEQTLDEQEAEEPLLGASKEPPEYRVMGDTLLIVGIGAIPDDPCWTGNFKSDIRTIEVGDGVTSIGELAFKSFPNLETVHIGANVSYIGDKVFLNCPSLKTLTIPASVKDCGHFGVFKKSSVETVIWEDGSTKIPEFFFREAECLKSVTIPETVSSIGMYAFSGCFALTEITLPDAVTRIDSYAFKNCSALTELKLPSSLSYIGEAVLSGCTGVKSISFPASLTSCKSPLSESSVETAILEEGGTEVINGLFAGGEALKSITLPEDLTRIGSSAFSNCSSLESLELPDSIATIDTSAFGNCSGLHELRLPSALNTLGQNILEGCTGLTGITVPAGLAECSPYGFLNNSSVTSLIVEEGMTELPEYFAYNAKLLTDVQLPESLLVIGYCAFRECQALKGIQIPDSVTTIKENAFSFCYALEELNLPKSLTTIGGGNLWDNTLVKTLTLPASLTSCTSISLLSHSGVETLVAEEGMKHFPKNICGFSNLETLILPASLESIDPYAFSDTTTLKTIRFAGSERQWNAMEPQIPEGCEVICTGIDDPCAEGHHWLFDHIDTATIPYYNVYRCENCTETKREELPPAPVETVELDCGKELIVDVGSEAVTINASVSPINAQQGVSWSGMNSAYGEFEQQGSSLTLRNFTGKTGSLTLSATATDGSKKKATVKLKFVRLMRDDDLDFAETAVLASGKALTLKATVAKGVSNPKLAYTMDTNPYATLKGDKLSAAKNLSESVTVTVTATAQDGSGVSKSCAVTLYPIATSVNISGAPENTVDLSETVQLSASVAPLNACQQVTWKSSSKLFTIDENGLVTVAENAKAATVTFTATAAEGSGKKAAVKVKFVRLMRDEDVTMDTDYVLAAGKSVQFKPSVNKAVTNAKFSYTMPESEFATLKNGKLTAAKLITEPVTVTVTATAQDGSGVVRELHVTLYPAVKAVHIYNSIGEDVTGKTLDFTGKLSLRLSNESVNAAQRWTVKSSSKAVSAEIYGDSVAVSLASALKIGSKFTLTFTAADGSGKSAKVNFKYTGEPTDYKIAIMTGNATQATEEYNAARMLADADPEHVLMDTYTDDFATGVDITVEKLLAFAADPEVKAILFVQAVQGCSEAFAQIREERPDILLIAGIPAEDSATVTAAADVVLANDELACGAQVADKAAEWGCDVLVHYSFERHLGYETIVARRDVMKQTAEAHGIAFVERDAPDPAGSVGLLGAQTFILEDVPRVMEEYAGKKVCFYCTNCGLQSALQKAVLAEASAYYALPCCPGPFHGFQEAFGLESSYSDFDGSLKIIAEYLKDYNACGRFSTWAVPVNMGVLLGGYEYASAWCKGELSRKLDLTKLTECMSKATGTDAELGVYVDPQGNAYENYRLISFEPIDFVDYLLTPGSAVI